MTVPRPLPSPRPPGYHGPELSEEPITASRIPATLGDVKHVRLVALAQSVVAVVACLGALVAGINSVKAWAVEAGEEKARDAGLLAVETREELRQYKREITATMETVLEELRENRLDMRAFYRSEKTGQPSPRLERALPTPKKDGGR